MTTETNEFEIPFDPAYVTQWLLDSIIVAYRDGYTQGYIQGLNTVKTAEKPNTRGVQFGIGDIV
jgi:hypothetical protein